MTRNDQIDGNRDLIARAAGMLSTRKMGLGIKVEALKRPIAGSDWTLGVQTKGLVRIDMFVNDRPIGPPIDVTGNTMSQTVSVPAKIRLDGHNRQGLFARYQFWLDEHGNRSDLPPAPTARSE